jgi:cytochrome c oxidase subunit II
LSFETISRRRLAALALLLAGAFLAVAAPSALADAVTPESGGSPNANDIDTLYKIVLYVGIVIFLGVEGVLIWSLVKYRARRGGPAPAMIRGNTPLELGWTIGAALILVVLAAITFIYLPDIKNPENSSPGGYQAAQNQFAVINQPPPPNGKSLKIRVVGRQYLWRFDYPGKPGELFSYYEMVVPVNTTVTLSVTAEDVIHSWWIPKLGGKVDGVPSYTNETWFRIPKPGIYRGQCAELCGENHADMRAQVRALPVDEFEQWMTRQKNDIKAAQTALAEQRRAREAEDRRAQQQAGQATSGAEASQ